MGFVVVVKMEVVLEEEEVEVPEELEVVVVGAEAFS